MSDDAILISDLRKMIDNLLRLIAEKDALSEMRTEYYNKEVEKNIALEKEIKRLTGD